jgi:NifB/MoaA-like Fe-S oxidoreductase
MTESESLAGDLAAIQEELREILPDLKGIDRRLRAIHGRLPGPSDAEMEQEAEDEEDVATEIRSVIECVLTDSLGPAIRDLETASRYGVKGRTRRSSA